MNMTNLINLTNSQSRRCEMRRNFGNKTLILVQNRKKKSHLTIHLTVCHISGHFLFTIVY